MYVYCSLFGIFLSEFWRVGQPHVKFNLKEAAGQEEWVYVQWRLPV